MKIIALNRYFLDLTGLLKQEQIYNQSSDVRTSQSIRGFISWIWLCVVTVPMFLTLVKNITDFGKTTEVLYIVASAVLAIGNTGFFLYSRDTLSQIIQWLQQNFNERIKVQPNQHYRFAETVSNFCSKLYLNLVFANIGVIFLVPLIVSIYLYATNDVMLTDMWILPVPSVFTVTSLRVYLLVLLSQLLWFCSIAFALSCHQGIFLGLAVHIIACFKDIEMKFLKIKELYHGQNARELSKDLEIQLKSIVDFHTETITFLRKLISFASGVVFLVFFTLTCVVIAVGLRVIHPSNSNDEPQTNQRIRFIFVSINGLFTMLIYAFLGNEITHEANRVAEYAYQSDWYDYPVYLQKYILLMMMEAQREKRLTGLKLFYCTLASYKEVINFVVSILIILEQIDG